MRALALLLLIALVCVEASSAQTAAAPSTGATQAAQELPAAVTEDEIAVNSDYRGFSITVFGFNPDRYGRGDVVVAVRGPNRAAIVQRKRRWFGLWVNGPPVHFSQAPTFHAVISARPLRRIASPQEIWALKLDPAASAQLSGAVPPDADPSAYREALVRLRSEAGLYSENARGLEMLSGNRLFRAQIRIPANAPLGDYVADVYLFRNGRMVSAQRSPVSVSRAGFERRVHDLATGEPFFYGLLVVAMALGAGWGAAYAFRRS